MDRHNGVNIIIKYKERGGNDIILECPNCKCTSIEMWGEHIQTASCLHCGYSWKPYGNNPFGKPLKISGKYS